LRYFCSVAQTAQKQHGFRPPSRMNTRSGRFGAAKGVVSVAAGIYRDTCR
jgi:hypothetical protein